MSYAITAGYASKEVLNNQSEISQLIDKLDAPEEMFMVIWPLCITHLVQADYTPAKKLANDLMRIANDKGLAEYVFPASLLSVGIDWQTGHLNQASNTAELALAQYVHEKHHHLAKIYTYDPGVAIMIVQSLVAWSLNNKQQAKNYSEKALTLSRAKNDPQDLAHTLTRIGQLAVFTKDYTLALHYAEETIKLAQKHGMTLWLHIAQVVRGWAYCALNQGDNSVLKEIKVACDGVMSTGTQAMISHYLTLLAEAQLNCEHTEQALITVDKAINLGHELADTFYLPESHRLKAHILNHMVASKSNNEPKQQMEQLIEQQIEQSVALIEHQKAFGFSEQILKAIDTLNLSPNNKQWSERLAVKKN